MKDVAGAASALDAHALGHGDVDGIGVDVAEVVNIEGRVVAEHGLLVSRPEQRERVLIIGGSREFCEAVDTLGDASDFSAIGELGQLAPRKTEIAGVAGCHEPVLF